MPFAAHDTASDIPHIRSMLPAVASVFMPTAAALVESDIVFWATVNASVDTIAPFSVIIKFFSLSNND